MKQQIEHYPTILPNRMHINKEEVRLLVFNELNTSQQETAIKHFIDHIVDLICQKFKVFDGETEDRVNSALYFMDTENNQISAKQQLINDPFVMSELNVLAEQLARQALYINNNAPEIVYGVL